MKTSCNSIEAAGIRFVRNVPVLEGIFWLPLPTVSHGLASVSAQVNDANL